MIRLISGSVIRVTPQGVVLECNNMGYLVRTTKKSGIISGDQITLHTHLAVRENALDLYGFLTEIELDCFELLLGISKIGPKSALQILDAADVSLILEAVNLGDATHLHKLSGITKKTAEKIVTELKDKVEALTFDVATPQTEQNVSAYNDVFDTLLTLGYNPINIRRALEELDITESTSSVVRKALQLLS
jgi:holliday junction DNA helicase RuvA